MSVPISAWWRGARVHGAVGSLRNQQTHQVHSDLSIPKALLLEHVRQGPDLYSAIPSESIPDLFFWGPRAGGAHFPAFFGIRLSSSAWHLVMKCRRLAFGGQRPRMMPCVYNVQNNPTTKNGLSSPAASTQTEKPCTWHLCQIRGGSLKVTHGKSPKSWLEIAELQWHKMIFPFYYKG